MTAVGLTNTDLSIHDNLVQARWEFDRADTGTKLAAWADRWGRSFVDEVQNPTPNDDADDIEDLRNDLNDTNNENIELTKEIEELRTDSDNMAEAIEKAIDELHADGGATATLVADMLRGAL